MGFNVRTEAERVSGEIEAMKKNVKQKAKKQIDDLIDNLKTNEFLKSPAIQSLVEKVGHQKELNQKFNKKIENVRNDVVKKVQAPVKRVKRAAQKAETAVNKVKSASPKQLLNMIKTSDVANRIANTILAGAENINQKWLETVAKSPLSKKAKKSKVKKTAKAAAKPVAKKMKAATSKVKRAAKKNTK